MKYLVALDGSKDAERAFDVVLCKATEQDHVFLLMVAEEVYVSAVGGASAYIDYSYIVRANQQIEEETKALLRSYGRRLTARKIPHTLLMGKGDPKEVLVREADAREVEMLVIGRRGLGRFKRFFLGSVRAHSSSRVALAYTQLLPNNAKDAKNLEHPSIFQSRCRQRAHLRDASVGVPDHG